jgi:pimeloyl-ACP methyl ester carboxylesterase
MQRFVRLLAMSTASAAILAGCQDATAPSRAATPVRSAALGSGELRDPGIHLGDTHFGARLVTRTTIDAPRPGADGGSFAQVSATSEVYERYSERYVEGGYGQQGEVRFGVYWDDPVASPEVGSIRTIGDQVSSYNRWGGMITGASFDAFMREYGLPGGSLFGGFFTSGSGRDGGGKDCGMNVDTCGPAEPYSLPGGGTVTDRESGGWREVRVVLSGAELGSAGIQSAGEHVEVVRRYRRMPAHPGSAGNAAWRLEEVKHTATTNTPAGPRTARSDTRVEYVRWHRNAGKDAAREQKAASRPAPAATAKPSAATASPAFPPATSGAEASGSVEAAFIDVCGRKSSLVNHHATSGSAAVIWQHGICSDASTWDGMRPRISSVLAVGHERAFSLTSRERLDVQTTELEQEVVASGGGQSIVVGHSQGGLIARRFAQRRNDLVRGVVTLGTPHRGALIADLGPDMASDYVAEAVGQHCYGSPMCTILNETLVRRATGEITYGLAGTLVPVIHDVRTNSTFTNQLNSTYEPFLRAGIEVDAGNRWALMRLIGDITSDRTRLIHGSRPYGDVWVRTTENVYRAGIYLQDLAMFLSWYAAPFGGGVDCGHSGYRANWPPCYDHAYGGYWTTSSYWVRLAAVLLSIGEFVTSRLDWLDETWNYVTTRGGDRTDGFIQFKSQRYPASPGAYAPLIYTIRPPDADSHTGETASPTAFFRVLQALESMGVARR